MGGSLARGLKALELTPHIAGFSLDPADGQLALDSGSIDELALDPSAAAAGRDLVVYATPLGVTLELLREHSRVWGEAVVTDLVSLKSPIMDTMTELSEGSRYVGSHPMAGGAATGFAASTGGLFEDAPIWLVRGEGATRAAEGLEQLWCALGASPLWVDPSEHDANMTWVSHLPQLVANSLAAALANAGYMPSDLGPGGKDMIRLAESSPEMWRDLLDASAPHLVEALNATGGELGRVAAALECRDLTAVVELMRRTKEWRGGP